MIFGAVEIDIRLLMRGNCSRIATWSLVVRSEVLRFSRSVFFRSHAICANPYRMNPSKLTAIDTRAMAWEERFNERIGRALFRKELYTDPETGVLVRLVRYPAGVINPKHTHPCGHGMYVLEVKLVTHNGTFGPGTFIWFPAGEVMEHGASLEGDVTVLFVTNKAFRIDYLDEKSS